MSGYSGSGVSGWSGFSGVNGASGFSGISGWSGISGFSGISGTSGFSGTSGWSGISGFSGASGLSGFSGASGISGFSGASGISGFSGRSGFSGTNGANGTNGASGFSGASGISGFSGTNGTNGTNGASGFSGTSGFSGWSGISGFSGVQATSVPWNNVSSKPSNIMYYQGFTLDANTMDSNATGFTYSVNAPYTGPVARFSTGGGYDLWLNAPYNSGGYGLAFRTRNGDTASFNSWQYPAVYGINVNGGGALYATLYYDQSNAAYYADPASTSNFNQINMQGYLRRNTSAAGYLEGNYPNSVDSNSSSCIYTIGGSYQPTSTGLGNMYGIGYTVGSGTANPGLGQTGWGMYVASGGASSIFLNSDSGVVISNGSVRTPIFYDSNNVAYYVDPASTSNLVGLTVVNTISGSINGNANTATTAANSNLLNSLSSTQLFNNMGQNHNTYTDANSFTNFGTQYLQGSTNGPGAGGTQWYMFGLGLGNEYSYSNYAMQLAIPRTPVGGNPYISVRFREGGSWNSWAKIWAGNADTATTANALNTGNSYSGTAFTATGGTDGYFYANRAAISGQAGIQFRTAGSTNWFNFLDNNTNTLTWYQTNTNTSVMTLTQAGVLTAVSVTASSDETLKTNWRDLSGNFIEELSKVKHGTYDRIDQDITQDGVSAQSLNNVMPHSVITNENGLLSVNYGNAALVAAVKLAQRVVEQDARIARLEALIEKLIGDQK